MDEPFRRVLVEVRDHRAGALHGRVHRGVVRPQPLLEERRQVRAVHQVVVDGRVGQVAHEIDLPVEDRLQLLEADDKGAVKARVFMQRRRHVHRVGLSRRIEQVAQLAVERHANLVRHSESEHRDVGPLEPLGAQDRARAEHLLDIRASTTEVQVQLAVADADASGGRQQALFDWRAVKGVHEQLELPRMRLAPHVQIRCVRLGELRHLQRQERPPVAAEFDRTDADDRHLEMPRQNGVELGDAAGPRVQMVSADAIDHGLLKGPPSSDINGRPLILHELRRGGRSVRPRRRQVFLGKHARERSSRETDEGDAFETSPSLGQFPSKFNESTVEAALREGGLLTITNHIDHVEHGVADIRRTIVQMFILLRLEPSPKIAFREHLRQGKGLPGSAIARELADEAIVRSRDIPEVNRIDGEGRHARENSQP